MTDAQDLSVESIAARIDHAILKPELTRADVDAELGIARRWGVFSVCVRPSDVAYSVSALAGSGVLSTTVIGFPHGTTTTAAKVDESVQAIEDGAASNVPIGRVLAGTELPIDIHWAA